MNFKSLLIFLAVCAVGAGLWFGRSHIPGLASRFGGSKTNALTNAVAAKKAGIPPTPAPPPQASAAKPPQPGAKPGATGTNAAARLAGTNNVAGLTGMIQRWKANRAFYPILGGVLLVVAGGLLIWVFSSGKKKTEATESLTPTILSKPAKGRAGSLKFVSCNVLREGGESRQLWQFDTRNNRFALDREVNTPASTTLPRRGIVKDWRNLWQKKLNVAWLPADQVYLRVVQVPQSGFEETVAMVELQLEKLSPIPVVQVMWSIHVLPHTTGELQTVIVVLASRSSVEEHLGQLEGQGYLADRLEVPMLDQLQATAITGDGVWIYPEGMGGANSAVAAWWYGGVLHNLDLISLPPENRAASLKEQLTQSAWAGEMEGWLTSPPIWHLVMSGSTAAEWQAALTEALGHAVDTTPAVPTSQLAALTARRATQADARVNLVPTEFVTRYQAQFVDKLWMRGLLAIGGAYIVGVLIYGALVGVTGFRANSVEKEIVQISPDYTNAIRLRDQLAILQERNELKFAALDCWKKIAELLSGDLGLESMNLSEGKKLVVAGKAPTDQVQQIYEFEKALRSAKSETGKPLFDENSGEHTVQHTDPGGATVSWNFSVDLKRSEGL